MDGLSTVCGCKGFDNQVINFFFFFFFFDKKIYRYQKGNTLVHRE